MPARSRKKPTETKTPSGVGVSINFDELFGQVEIEEPAKADRLKLEEIPDVVRSYVAKAFQENVWLYLPVRDADEYRYLRRLLQSAGDYHEPKLTVQVTPIGRNGKAIAGRKVVDGDTTTVTAPDLGEAVKLRFTAGERRGRKPGNEKS